MNKKKILKKQELLFTDIPITKIDETKIKELKEVKPEQFFQNHDKIGAALLECLIENDTESFIEILDEYLQVNRSRVAKNANIARSTVQEIFSKKGNPTLKTIAKIVHHEAGYVNSSDEKGHINSNTLLKE